MDIANRTVWITCYCSLLVAASLTLYAEAEADDNGLLGSHHYRTCREDNVTFTWPKPANLSGVLFMDLIFVPRNPGNDSNNRDIILSVASDGSLTMHTRYVGRLSVDTETPEYKFKLMTVNPKDRGSYEMVMISTTSQRYIGYADLTVYAEDNLWPVEDKALADVSARQEMEIPNSYHYPFKKHEESPVIGMMMRVRQSDVGGQTCYFGNTSRCEIVFYLEDLTGLSGTIRFDVTPLMENDTLKCHAVEMTYDYKITIMTAKLSSALKGGIVLSVFIALAACIIPPIVMHIKTKREKYIPLRGGYSFIRGCVDRIEATPELSDVYRKNAHSKMVHPHVKSYFQDPKSREVFFQDEGLTKIYFAAFIKYYITNVCEPLIPLGYIHKIKNGEVDEYTDVTNIKDVMLIKRKDSKFTKERKRILKILFQHWFWFRQRKIDADGSDSEQSSPTKILTTTGLAGLLAMNFDRTDARADMEEFERLARLTRFIKRVIIDCEQIFGSREETNGNISNMSLDLTTDPLLDHKV